MKKYFLPFIYALPSVLIGTLVMYMQGISVTIYIRNFIFLIIGSILSIIYMLRKNNIKLKHICAIAVFNASFNKYILVEHRPSCTSSLCGRYTHFGSRKWLVIFIFLYTLSFHFIMAIC